MGKIVIMPFGKEGRKLYSELSKNSKFEEIVVVDNYSKDPMVKRIHEVDNSRMYTWYIATLRRDAYFACRKQIVELGVDDDEIVDACDFEKKSCYKDNVIPHLGVMATSFCNLKCKNCADLIPQRSNYHYDIEDIKKDLQSIFDSNIRIEKILLIGGEILLYPDLDELLEFCISHDEYIGHIELTTNGTIMPNEKIWSLLVNPRVVLRVSGYSPKVAPKRQAIIEMAKSRKVKIEDLEGMKWFDIGGVQNRGRTPEQMKAIFTACSMRECVTLCKGGLIVYCSREEAALETELLPTPTEEEYVNVRKYSGVGLQEELVKSYAREYITACNFCDGLTPDSVEIPVAEQ